MENEFLTDSLRVFVVPVDIMNVPDLTIYEQMVYMVLRSFANPQSPTAFPSYATIAKLGRMCRRQAISSVAGLLEKGLLKKETRFEVTKDKQIRNTSNLYHIEMPAISTKVAPSDDPPAESDDIDCLQQEIEHELQIKVPKKEVSQWVTDHGSDYIREKITIIKGQGTSSPLRSLRAAVKHNWQPKTQSPKAKIATATPRQPQRVVPAAQPGKYERFYQVYGDTQNTVKDPVT